MKYVPLDCIKFQSSSIILLISILGKPINKSHFRWFFSSRANGKWLYQPLNCGHLWFFNWLQTFLRTKQSTYIILVSGHRNETKKNWEWETNGENIFTLFSRSFFMCSGWVQKLALKNFKLFIFVLERFSSREPEERRHISLKTTNLNKSNLIFVTFFWD